MKKYYIKSYFLCGNQEKAWMEEKIKYFRKKGIFYKIYLIYSLIFYDYTEHEVEINSNELPFIEEPYTIKGIKEEQK